jgi:hypothetical protein
MINKILEHHKILNNLYYQLDKTREVFDFNNPTPTFQEIEKWGKELKTEITKHFELQEQLKNQINVKVDKIVLENMLVKSILIRMCNKIISGGENQDINIFNFFEDLEEILKAYLKKEKGLFIQQLNQATNEEEKQRIKKILS